MFSVWPLALVLPFWFCVIFFSIKALTYFPQLGMLVLLLCFIHSICSNYCPEENICYSDCFLLFLFTFPLLISRRRRNLISVDLAYSVKFEINIYTFFSCVSCLISLLMCRIRVRHFFFMFKPYSCHRGEAVGGITEIGFYGMEFSEVLSSGLTPSVNCWVK